MKIIEIKIMKSVLSEGIGWSWPLFLIRCLIRKSSVFKNTHWAKEKSTESEFAKRLSIAAAIYLSLVEKIRKEKALELMREILIPVSVSEMEQNLDSSNISGKRGIDKLSAFWDSTRKGGVGQFNQETLIKLNRYVLHYQVTNCFFARFYQETGTPELTKLLCESDKEFWPKAFSDLKFHRGSSWENTIAYGKDHCEFIFEMKH
ncbi:hypothetical protein ES708_34839 [subsurface metagenome]